ADCPSKRSRTSRPSSSRRRTRPAEAGPVAPFYTATSLANEVVNLVDALLGRLGDPGLAHRRSDLPGGKLLVCLLRLPDVDGPDSVVRLRRPVGDRSCRARGAWLQTHCLDHLVVLIERRALVGHLDGDRHHNLLHRVWMRDPNSLRAPDAPAR